MDELNLQTLYDDLTKPGRKGCISEVARRCKMHRNTVRSILKGKPGRGLNTALVIQQSGDLLREFEQADALAVQVIQEQIKKHQQKIKRLRSQAAA